MRTGLRPVTPRYYKPPNPHPVEPDGGFLKHAPLGGAKTGTAMNIRATFIYICILLLTQLGVAYADFNPMMGPYLDADKFAERIYARYGIMPRGLYRQPMGSGDFLSFLDSASNLPLTGQERYTLDGLRGRLSQDIGIYGFRYDDRETAVIVNLDLTGEMWAGLGGGADARGGGRGIIGPSMRGRLGKISFYSAVDVWTEYAYDSIFPPPTYQPYDGMPSDTYGRRADRADGANMRSSNIPRCGISYDAGRFSLQAAIDYLRLGPAAHYPVTLSGTAPPIVYARALFDLTYVEYQHIAGLLRSQKNTPKYIYSNRLSGSFFNGRFQWGINEVIVHGSQTNQQDNDSANLVRDELKGQKQSWEPAYLVPFVPMVYVEHYVGDLQNAALSFDFCFNIPRDFRFYGEFFLDDMMTPWEIASDDWGNKWALTLGAQYFTNIRGRDVSAGLEWSRVEPWVYTHVYGGSHRYDHFNKPLGAPLGPNSMAIAANCDMSVTKKGIVGLKLTSVAANPTVRGGKITDIFQGHGGINEPDSETKKFLGAGTVHHLRPGIYGTYNPFGLFRLDASVEVDAAEDRGRVHLGLDGVFHF